MTKFGSHAGNVMAKDSATMTAARIVAVVLTLLTMCRVTFATAKADMKNRSEILYKAFQNRLRRWKMSKVEPLGNQDGSLGGYTFWCPGCDSPHLFDLRWEFNGDVDNPTFSPSLLVNGREPRHPNILRCHSFVRNGKIEFLGDCEHTLAGQTVELPDYREAIEKESPNA